MSNNDNNSKKSFFDSFMDKNYFTHKDKNYDNNSKFSVDHSNYVKKNNNIHLSSLEENLRTNSSNNIYESKNNEKIESYYDNPISKHKKSISDNNSIVSNIETKTNITTISPDAIAFLSSELTPRYSDNDESVFVKNSFEKIQHELDTNNKSRLR